MNAEEKDIEHKRRKKLRNEITHKLRFDVLERDGFKCGYCGASPKDDPSVELTVDHIKPIDKGGDNEMSNLITACYSCNEGKKSRLLKEKIGVGIDYYSVLDRILKVNTDEEIKEFLLSEDNKDIVKWMYDRYRELNWTACLENCKDCLSNGLNFYTRCWYNISNKVRKETKTLQLYSKDELKTKEETQPLLTIDTEKGLNPIVSDSAKLKCDSCYLVGRCPAYKVGALCEFDFSIGTDFSDIKNALRIIVNIQKERVVRSVLFEKIDGGAVDKNVSSEIMMLSKLLDQISDSNMPSASFTFTAKQQGNSGSDVLSNLFSKFLGGKSKDTEEVSTEEVPAEKASDEVSPK